MPKYYITQYQAIKGSRTVEFTVEAHSLEEALELFKSANPDVINEDVDIIDADEPEIEVVIDKKE